MTTNAIATVPVLSASRPIMLKGKVSGERHFMGSIPGRDIAAAVKAQHPTLSSRKRSKLVNQALRDEQTQRLIMATAWVQDRAMKGFIPDTADTRKASATLRMILPKTPKTPKPTKAEAKAAALEAAVKAELQGTIDSQAKAIAALQAQLDALLAK
jgi:hypothetical protein